MNNETTATQSADARYIADLTVSILVALEEQNDT
jgi:hypothetical protein